jgi:peptidoglycan/LPS O-acetylase OafA/YrhL
MGFFAVVLIPKYAPLFAGGMALYYVFREGHSFLPWALVGFNAILASHATVASYLPVMEKNTGHPILPAFVWLAIFASFALIALVTLTPLRNISWRWLTTAGALTYPLYLTHESFGKWIIHLAYPRTSGRVALVLGMTACLALAWLIHRFVERPWGTRLRQSSLRALDQAVGDTAHLPEGRGAAHADTGRTTAGLRTRGNHLDFGHGRTIDRLEAGAAPLLPDTTGRHVAPAPRAAASVPGA